MAGELVEIGKWLGIVITTEIDSSGTREHNGQGVPNCLLVAMDIRRRDFSDHFSLFLVKDPSWLS